MDKFREQAKGYIQMKEMSRFRNEVRQAEQKRDKREGGTKTDSHKSDKRHKLDKCQPLSKGARHESYTPLIPNRTIILEEAFNAKVPIKLPSTFPFRPELDKTKYCRCHRNYSHTTKNY